MDNAPRDDVSVVFGTQVPKPPSAKQQSWGAVISIIIIVLMIIVGAFYSWGKRIAQENSYTATTTVQTSL